MPKKFYDIIPPKNAKSEMPKVKASARGAIPTNVPKAEVLVAKKKEARVVNTNKSKGMFLKVLVGVACLLIICGISAYYVLAKTVINVFPKIEDFSLKTSVTIDPDAGNFDQNAKVLPGKVFKDQETLSQSFSSTGKTQKDAKASGTIRVYNSFSDASQSLVAGTRFVSTEGKLFKTTKKITVPGGTYTKGKITTPGYVDVTVEAAATGESYNIAPSTFSIPGFAGTAKYTAFYAKSTSPMTGGVIGQVAQVTAGDLDGARKALAAKLQEQSKTALKKAIPDDYVFVDSMMVFELSKENSSLKAQDLGNTFVLSMQIDSSILAFKKSDIDTFAKQFLNSNLASGKTIKEGTLAVNYADASASGSKETLNLGVGAKVYSTIDMNEFKKAVLGKSFEEIKVSLGDMPQIEKVEIKSAPLFEKKVSGNINKVQAELILD